MHITHVDIDFCMCWLWACVRWPYNRLQGLW